ncbi:phospho-N-acetylmuramoyl-pentapeptide-transferase [Aerococcaceae bacterium NML191292]|nr:phospho-N-acetylmuramoyl-pentapeptide-transferase [Aerococcaceae bacterium NML210727]MCW6654235.1 phospho-N-acetylmuramoyl-pentapeptide-transferase [Aerococcaceae bacterium NML201296]MCW6660223.1 phospho-N-acetylmuramoyl-pentapeptide-transferase [Aerococcaceae bacterium NML191292]MCW6661008.1 phospho-N-acetylmuramoyl-pentapeptide-transferase [Aerococcaceae bacterium NML201209]MCW6663601.1 phospho-N-acetylmuramoyl-pentapeptide-transferase [Aerococcaceae bacterium NML190073]MCW6664066.1 phosp
MELVLPLSISFALTVSLMPFFIGYFNYKKIGQTTREEGPKWHEVKTGTPTMGGTVFVSAILFTLLVSAKLMNLLNGQVWMIWLTFLLFGGIGFIDDFISIFKKQNEGLTAKQKFVAQLLFSGIIILIAIATGVQLVIPMYFFNITSVMLIVVFAFLWITGFSNAVNLTDGLDGLATGLNIIAYSAYFALALRTKNMAVALVCLTVVGALLGFLIYNKKPAKIFMGDVGSLALGAGLAVISMVLNNPWSLLIIGIVFVIETASVILQVASFKLTGKRIFKMSPIHHHFEMSGWSEQKVVTVFWAVGMLAAGFYYMIF